MAISNYGELLTALRTYMVYDDISTNSAQLLSLAEAVLNREIRIREMQSSQRLVGWTLGYVILPTTFAEMIAFYQEGEDGGTLELLPSKLFWDSRSARSGSGQPAFYTMRGRTLTLAPEPDGPRNYTYEYYQEVPGLTPSNTTNVILTRAPDVYMWAVLYQAAIFVGDETLEAKYDRNYTRAKLSLLAADKRSRLRPGTRMRARNTPDGRFKIA